MRVSKPEAGNKYYIRKEQGGYSPCIYGRPTDKDCNVLANCVGYAVGRFNEIAEAGYCKYLANTNAENFMKYRGTLEVGQVPRVGACMVWEGLGNLAGHVAIVEDTKNAEHVYTSESGYNSSPFWNQHRYKNDGNWGANKNYKFLGFIYNPAVKEEPFSGVSDEELARRVWTGEFGVGQARAKALGTRYNAVQALVNKGVGKPIPVVTGFRKGDIVVPTRLVSYTGQRLTQYDKQYIVKENTHNNQVILTAMRNGKQVIWATMNIKDVRRV